MAQEVGRTVRRARNSSAPAAKFLPARGQPPPTHEPRRSGLVLLESSCRPTLNGLGLQFAAIAPGCYDRRVTVDPSHTLNESGDVLALIDVSTARRKKLAWRTCSKRWAPSWSHSPAGVDSSYLLKIAHRALGPRAVAATGLSQTYAPEEMDEARIVAREIGAEHVLVDTAELTDPRYADNTHQRCFFCKTELYSRLKELGGLAVCDMSSTARMSMISTIFDPGCVPPVSSGCAARCRRLV